MVLTIHMRLLQRRTVISRMEGTLSRTTTLREAIHVYQNWLLPDFFYIIDTLGAQVFRMMDGCKWWIYRHSNPIITGYAVTTTRVTNNKIPSMSGYDSWNGLKQTSFDNTQCILLHDDDILCKVAVGELYKGGHENMRRFNMHNRDPHSRSCHKRKHAYDAEYCRMCFPRPCCSDTEFVQLVNNAPPPDPTKEGDGENKRLDVEVGTVRPTDPPPCHDIPAWDPSYYDDRVISLDIKRRWSRDDRKPVIKRNSMMLCRVFKNRMTSDKQLKDTVSNVISFLHGPKYGTDDKQRYL